MLRIGVEYDLLPRESEILHLKFWEQCFELLKERGAIHLEADGKNKGCWVMRSDSTGEMNAEAEDRRNCESGSRTASNGTVTYVGKDIASSALEIRIGSLGRNFKYVPFSEIRRWTHAMDERDQGLRLLPFGGASRVYNVIDTRQAAYLQNIVIAGLRALGYNAQADQSVHFAYEVVALSQRCARRNWVSNCRRRIKADPHVPKCRGCKGLGVGRPDGFDAGTGARWSEMASRQTDRDAAFQQRVARQIATGALRFFLLKFTRNTVIAFDFAGALSFRRRGWMPYVQYAAVRAANILRKAGEADGPRHPLRSDVVTGSPAAAARLLATLRADICNRCLHRKRQAFFARQRAGALLSEIRVSSRAGFQHVLHHGHHILQRRGRRKARLPAVDDRAVPHAPGRDRRAGSASKFPR